MKFLTLASTLLLAGGAIAAPGTARRAERHRKRVAERSGNPMIKSDGPAGVAATNSKFPPGISPGFLCPKSEARS